jgi:hypothetical protein
LTPLAIWSSWTPSRLVIGVARYLSAEPPIASWVVPLRERTAADPDTLLTGRCRVALVKTHTVADTSSAQAWVQDHAVLQRDSYSGSATEVRYYLVRSPARGRRALPMSRRCDIFAGGVEAARACEPRGVPRRKM